MTSDQPNVFSVEDATLRLQSHDSTLKRVCFDTKDYDDADLASLVDLLIANPDGVTDVFLSENDLTDKVGVKLAQYVAASATIEHLCLTNNHFTNVTFLALADALRVNTSLKNLYLFDNESENMIEVEAAFIQALRWNPLRPIGSTWKFYSFDNDFQRLKTVANAQGHPSLQETMLFILETQQCTNLRLRKHY
jgi:hypothetical protein